MKVLLVLSLFTIVSSVKNKCHFPPKPLGGDFKVIKLVPQKTIRYFCHPGFHLWGQEISSCDPEIGWPKKPNVECLVDAARGRLATSSSSKARAFLPIQGKWETKHEGQFFI